MRTVCSLYMEGMSFDDIVSKVVADNLFRYPTERMVPNIARVCCKRIAAVGSDELVQIIADGIPQAAAQANLYAMMCTYPLVRHFMVELIAKKYESFDYSLTGIDMGSYMAGLQYEYDDMAAASELTVSKIKQVLRKGLIECGMLENPRSTRLVPIYLEPCVRSAIAAKGDACGLAAFNCRDAI